MSGWKVEKDDTVSIRYGKHCGTRVTSPDGREMRWSGRMTKGEAIRQTEEYWAREARIDAHHDLMFGTSEEARLAIAFLDSNKSSGPDGTREGKD